MSGDDTKSDLILRALGGEVMKSKSIYDGSNRLITRYEAFTHSTNGDSCLRTDYTYVGATTSVDASKETVDVWQAAWDI